jgi:3-oxoacyl-[acyl-carrier-protein] synthase-3
MKIENVFLAGVGSYLPDRVTTAEAVERGWYDADANATSGMLSIGIAGETPAPDMAVSATNVAIKRARVEPEEVGGLIHSPIHFQGPEGWSAAHYILHNTVDRPVTAMEIRQGCLGMVTSIRLATTMLMSDPSMSAFLLTAADNFSTPIVDRWRASSHYVLGDGASAAVLSSRDGFARLLAAGSVSSPEAEILHRGGEPMFPPGTTVGRTLDIEGRSAYWQEQWANGVTPPTFHLGDLVTASATATLADAGLTMADISRVAVSGVVHEHVVHGILEPLGVAEERSTWEFTRRLGHSGGTDQIAGLEWLIDEGEIGAGDNVLLLSVTVGMEVGCVVLHIDETP